MMDKFIKSFLAKIEKALFVFYKRFMFNTIKDMDFTMRRYIPLVVDGDLQVLKKVKIRIPKMYLYAIYESITLEYIELSNSGELMAKIKEKDTLLTLQRKRKMLTLISYILSCGYATEEAKNKVTDYLKRNRIISKDILGAVESELKSLEVKITMIEEKLKQNTENSVSREDFFRMFAVLQKNGHNANVDMPVIGYVQVLDLYREEMKQLEKISKKNG